MELPLFKQRLMCYVNPLCRHTMNTRPLLQEMTEIVRAIYDMMGKYTYPALKGDVPQQHVDAFFQVYLW